MLGADVPEPPEVALPPLSGNAAHPMDLVAGPAGTALAHADKAWAAAWWDATLAAAVGIRPCPYPRGATRLRALPGFAVAKDLVEHRLGRLVRATPDGRLPSRPGSAIAVVSRGDPRTPRIVARLVRSPDGARRCTSARLLDDLEVALAARNSGSQSGTRHVAAQEAARTIAAQLAWRWERHGRGFPERMTASRHDLSILWGMPAIAHAVLRHAVAADLCAPRLLT